MKIYNYRPDTLDFVGASTADESPLEPGVYIIPAHATEIAPPEFDAATQTCRFNNGKWDVVDIPVPKPEPEPTAEEIKARRIAEINGFLTQIDIKYGPRYLREKTIADPGNINQEALAKLIAAEEEAIKLRAELYSLNS